MENYMEKENNFDLDLSKFSTLTTNITFLKKSGFEVNIREDYIALVDKKISWGIDLKSCDEVASFCHGIGYQNEVISSQKKEKSNDNIQ